MKYFRADSFAEAYQAALADVFYHPEYETSPRGMLIKESTNVQLEFNPMLPLYSNPRRSSQLRYIAAELLWYFAGRKDTEFISRFAKFWQSLDNGDGTVNSAYGNLIFSEFNLRGLTEWDWLMKVLVEDKDTRQAVIHFNKPDHKWHGNRDFVCTLSGTFQIRQDRLNFKVHMRSNDMILGTPTDVAFFCLLQQQVFSLLKPIYPGLQLGSYIHEVDSLHIYERHFGLVEEMLSQDFTPAGMPAIGENLIDTSGLSHPGVNRLISGIENETELQPESDELLEWIRAQINTLP